MFITLSSMLILSNGNLNMWINYKFKPSFVKRIIHVAHKGKKRNFNQPVHKHGPKAHEIIYVDYGELILDINDATMILNPGEAIIIPGDSPHSFSGKEGAPFDFMNIMFAGKIKESIFCQKIRVTRNCVNLLEQMKQESIQKMPDGYEIIACHLTELLIQFSRQLSSSVPGKPDEPAYSRRYRSGIVNRAMSVMASSYSKQLDLKRLSRSVGISIPHLRTVLKKETGENFTTILHKHRISAAKHLLREETSSIQDIAGAVGYSSSSFFFKVFRRQTGMTPKEYFLSLGDPSELG
jgi:AraC-like DNA-binding protein/mannose-6-phosphate isomerase-like protein (cupin superfamily)